MAVGMIILMLALVVLITTAVFVVILGIVPGPVFDLARASIPFIS